MIDASSFSEDQISTIQDWANSGEGLSGIQRRLNEDMEKSVTYLELRFLLGDLGIQLPDDAPAKPSEDEEAESEPNESADSDASEIPPVEDEGLIGSNDGKVSVTLDHVQRPGALISGKVQFDPTHSTGWQIDQMGRLRMDPLDDEDFRPSEEQLMEFQKQLQEAMQEQGGGF